MTKNEQADKPKEIEEIHQEFDLDSIELPPLEGHAWIQMGNQLICQSCSREHGIFLRPGYMYFGNDKKGLPIIKKLW